MAVSTPAHYVLTPFICPGTHLSCHAAVCKPVTVRLMCLRGSFSVQLPAELLFILACTVSRGHMPIYDQFFVILSSM